VYCFLELNEEACFSLTNPTVNKMFLTSNDLLDMLVRGKEYGTVGVNVERIRQYEGNRIKGR